MNRNLLAIALFASIASLAGCATPGASSKRSCGVPEGAPCMSVRDVYYATNHADRLTASSKPATRAVTAPTLMIEGESLVMSDQEQASAFPVETPPKTVPLRTQARVMRIWVAPWTDNAGDLHMGGHLFTEIEPRKWSVGNTAPTALSTIQPFQRLSSDQDKAEPTPR